MKKQLFYWAFGGVCRRDRAALSSGCKAHPATAPAGSSPCSHGGNEVAEAFLELFSSMIAILNEPFKKLE
jgi:hypothetical protein